MQEPSQPHKQPPHLPFANFNALSPLLSQPMINPNANNAPIGSPAQMGGEPHFLQGDTSPNSAAINFIKPESYMSINIPGQRQSSSNVRLTSPQIS